MPADPRPRNPRGSGSRLQAEIVGAAIALIDETNDPARLTLRGIARAASISAPSIYRHFADVDDVIEAVLAESFGQLTRTMTVAVDRKRRPDTALIAGCRAYVAFGWDHRARYRLMFAASGYADDAVAAFALIEATIVQAVQAGLSSSVDPHTDTFLLWAAMHGLATLDKPARSDRLRLGPIDRPGLIDVLVHRLAGLTMSTRR